MEKQTYEVAGVTVELTVTVVSVIVEEVVVKSWVEETSAPIVAVLKEQGQGQRESLFLDGRQTYLWMVGVTMTVEVVL